MAQGGSNSNIPVAEQFWAMVDKADRRFSRVRDLPIFGRNRNDLEFHKAFKIYTQLWKIQQENRQKLTEAGMKRWEVGEIASRIAQLYYGQYQRTADSACLAEAYVFYEAILDRDYFRDQSPNNNNPGGQEMVYINKQLRFLARFVTVCLMIGKKEMVLKLTSQLKSLLDDSRKFFQEAEFKQWKHVIQEISRFMKLDTIFMNKRPLRYSYLFDLNPNSLSKSKRELSLRDSVLSSHYPNEVKFTELSIDIYRMLQSLEWDPSGSFAQQNNEYENKSNLFSLDLKDHSLPPNPLKTILYRPSVSHFLTVLATKCEELPSEGILLIYLSAEGDFGGSSENFEKQTNPNFSEQTNPNYSEQRLYLGHRTNEGSNYIYPSDIIPFTRRPLFLIIDSPNAHAFKEINSQSKGETAAMILSPPQRYISMTSASPDSPSQNNNNKAHNNNNNNNNGGQFTVFLTAPIQGFWNLIGKSQSDFDMDKYNEAEKLLCESLNDFEKILQESSTIDPIWIEVLGDPFLRRFLLRFVFCRAAIGLCKVTSENDDFAPTCYPLLPESVKAESVICRSSIKKLAVFLDVIDEFNI